MHGSAPWKTEETIVGLPRLLVLSVFSRFGGCHISPCLPRLLVLSVFPDLVAVTFQEERGEEEDLVAVTFGCLDLVQIWWLSPLAFTIS